MSGNISEAMIIGIAIIMVASLVSTGLNLMVMSNSLLSGGTTTLQSGIDSISTQEFASFDNTKVSGTQVMTALSQFQGRDIAIVVQTTAFSQINAKVTKGANAADSAAVNINGKGSECTYNELAINYGALLCSDGKSSSGNNNTSVFKYGSTICGYTTSDGKSEAPTATGIGNFLSPQAKTARLVQFVDGAQTEDLEALYRVDGAPNYTGYLHNSYGLVDTSYDTIGTTELGNAGYILSSARFSSVLIKDPTGSIIGIFFKQLN